MSSGPAFLLASRAPASSLQQHHSTQHDVTLLGGPQRDTAPAGPVVGDHHAEDGAVHLLVQGDGKPGGPGPLREEDGEAPPIAEVAEVGEGLLVVALVAGLLAGAVLGWLWLLGGPGEP